MKSQVDIFIHTDIMFDGVQEVRGHTIVIDDGDIIDLCDAQYATQHYSPGQTIDARQHFVLPGLIEGHGHLLLMGRLTQQVDLSSYTRWEDIEDAIIDRAAHQPRGTWIIGHGWHQAKWSETPDGAIEDYPSMKRLSQALPDHPVYLQHASLHAAIANQAALDVAGISPDAVDPRGGRLLRDDDGHLTGMLLEDALLPVRDLINRLDASYDRRLAAYRSAARTCHSYGITSFHDAALSLDEIAFFKQLDSAGNLDIHLYGMAYDDIGSLYDEIDHWPIRSRHLHVAAVKNFYDGALGSRSALLSAPYSDDHDLIGLRLMRTSEVDSTIRLCGDHDLQYCVHAIGDLACTEVIDRISAHRSATVEHRSRIEHAQHIQNDDLDRMAELRIIASVQPIHCTSDAGYLYERLGADRAHATSFRWRDMIDRGIHMAIGTDVPVEPIQPYHNIYAACTRRPLDSQDAYQPQQVLTRLEALQMYTSANAYAAKQEHIRGRIATGMAADIAIVDRDLLRCPDTALLDARALMTIYDGRIVFDATQNSTQ